MNSNDTTKNCLTPLIEITCEASAVKWLCG